MTLVHRKNWLSWVSFFVFLCFFFVFFNLLFYLHLFLCLPFSLFFSPCSYSLMYINLLHLPLFNFAYLFRSSAHFLTVVVFDVFFFLSFLNKHLLLIYGNSIYHHRILGCRVEDRLWMEAQISPPTPSIAV